MKRFAETTLLILVLAGLAACTDDATLPAPVRDASHAQSQGNLQLPWVVVTVPHCDPLTDLNWCQEDDGGGTCTTSAGPGSPDGFQSVSGCETPGTGGTGAPGGGGGSPGDGTPPPDEPAPYDYDPGMAPPDCTKPVLESWEHAYCTSEIAAGERLTRTVQALQRLSARGGECANIAAFGEALLQSGMIRYFPHVESIHGDAAGWGDADIGALLGSFWVDNFGGAESGFRIFDNKLIHEIEHVMGRGHFPDANTDETPNSVACSGLG